MNIFGIKNNVIEYTVNKADNKGIYISVQNGEVLVNAPWYVTSNQIQEVVEQKRKWIIEKLNEYELKRKNINKYIYLLGNKYELEIKYENISVPEVNVENSIVEILLPNKYRKIDNRAIIQIVLNKLIEKVAQDEIEMAMEKARVLLGFAPEDFKIENMGNTLGKCENKVITINPEIAKYNRTVIEYVVMHEYCHLKYKTHSKKFLEMIEKNQKNYKKIENLILKYKF